MPWAPGCNPKKNAKPINDIQPAPPAPVFPLPLFVSRASCCVGPRLDGFGMIGIRLQVHSTRRDEAGA